MKSRKTKIGEFKITKEEVYEGIKSLIDLTNIYAPFIGGEKLEFTDQDFQIWFCYDECKDCQEEYFHTEVLCDAFIETNHKFRYVSELTDELFETCLKAIEDDDELVELTKGSYLVNMRIGTAKIIKDRLLIVGIEL